MRNSFWGQCLALRECAGKPQFRHPVPWPSRQTDAPVDLPLVIHAHYLLHLPDKASIAAQLCARQSRVVLGVRACGI